MTVAEDVAGHLKKVTTDATWWGTGNIIWVAALACCILSCCGFWCYIYAPQGKSSVT